ncbi:2-C-methyl-D-erythritol 4-phosphate cytidylyltransferase [Desulfurobacterium thermolithotrophum DSM 11699]|uniref:2-C-methyl-D-erythritol 4-phosphate cytidylyltransferase n=1 Tax=Desulfurobacterium thermolithotrophum (strain DSM 11699 / BSA) TaxID=868864 RepID=F0S3C6_DESTD|nr:2-C-methyl-D-erythritol 4-phosphate cytidylyltransferase [Desulfurobacterium thermolithotrophum]ADY73348.1 2-C-methyl-D-erythritol 4-phosphate cytidylyltransferase [Desulfurobacterium thermolithotrophum DSM 11699]
MRFAVIPAAGVGRRFGGKKQFFEVNGKPLIEYPLKIFQKSELVHGIILVLPKGDLEFGKKLKEKFSKIIRIVEGGRERQESVYQGLKSIKEPVKEVIIHDGVRPVISTSLIRDLVISFSDYDVDGVILGVKPKETVKEIGAPLEPGDFFVKKTLNRDKLILVQTPQIFSYQVLLECHEIAKKEEYFATDDSALLEKYGYSIISIPGDYKNIKVTTPEDLEIVSTFLS